MSKNVERDLELLGRGEIALGVTGAGRVYAARRGGEGAEGIVGDGDDIEEAIEDAACTEQEQEMRWMKTGEGLEITKDTKAFYYECPNCCFDQKIRVEWEGDSVVLTRGAYEKEDKK